MNSTEKSIVTIKDSKGRTLAGTPLGSPLPLNLHYYYARVTADFCPHCKHRYKDAENCPYLSLGSGICLSFAWLSENRRKTLLKEVFENRAVTGWLKKKKSLEEINAMSENMLFSILNRPELYYFSQRNSVKQILSLSIKEEAELSVCEQISYDVPNTKGNQTDVDTAKSPQKTVSFSCDLLGNPICKKGEKKMFLSPRSPLPTNTTATTKKKRVTAKEIADSLIAKGNDIHLFHCQKPDGSKITYKRNMHAASYASDVSYFRKELEKKQIVLLSEEYASKEASAPEQAAPVVEPAQPELVVATPKEELLAPLPADTE